MRTTKWRTLALPRVFADWQGPLFAAGWRAAFFYTGVVAVLLGVVYAAVGIVGVSGLAIGFTSGAIVAQVPSTFPDRSETVAGVVGEATVFENAASDSFEFPG